MPPCGKQGRRPCPQGQPGNSPWRVGGRRREEKWGHDSWVLCPLRAPHRQRRAGRPLPGEGRRGQAGAGRGGPGTKRDPRAAPAPRVERSPAARGRPAPMGEAETIERSRALARHSAPGVRLSAAAILLEAAEPARAHSRARARLPLHRRRSPSPGALPRGRRHWAPGPALPLVGPQRSLCWVRGRGAGRHLGEAEGYA